VTSRTFTDLTEPIGRWTGRGIVALRQPLLHASPAGLDRRHSCVSRKTMPPLTKQEHKASLPSSRRSITCGGYRVIRIGYSS
jgi:hypothetical protein